MKQSKRKKWIYLLICMAVIFIVSVFLWFVNRTNWEYTERNESIDGLIHAERSTLNPYDIIYIMDDDVFPRLIRGRYIPEQYIWLLQEQSRTPYGTIGLRYYEWLTSKVEIYDVFTKELIRTIDVLEIIADLGDEIEEGFVLLHGGPGTIFKGVNGYTYLEWILLRSRGEPGEGNDRLFITMNITSGSVSLHEVTMKGRNLDEQERELFDQVSFLIGLAGGSWEVSGQSLFANSGIFINDRDDFSPWPTYFFGTVVVEFSTKLLPEENDALYSRFPQLRQFQDEEGLRGYMILTERPTAEDIFALFVDDRNEISFEGLILSGEYSIDGNDHEIHSFEDFFRWRDTSRWLHNRMVDE